MRRATNTNYVRFGPTGTVVTFSKDRGELRRNDTGSSSFARWSTAGSPARVPTWSGGFSTPVSVQEVRLGLRARHTVAASSGKSGVLAKRSRFRESIGRTQRRWQSPLVAFRRRSMPSQYRPRRLRQIVIEQRWQPNRRIPARWLRA